MKHKIEIIDEKDFITNLHKFSVYLLENGLKTLIACKTYMDNADGIYNREFNLAEAKRIANILEEFGTCQTTKVVYETDKPESNVSSQKNV